MYRIIIIIIIDNCGMSYMWLDQDNLDTVQCKLLIHKRIEDISLQQWFTDIASSSMCIYYRLFKKQFGFENYLLSYNYKDRISLTKFRCANIRLPVYNQIYMYDTDKCILCDCNVCGDEYHYIFICPFFSQTRKTFLKRHYYNMASISKYEELFSSTNKITMSKLLKFIKIILEHF